MPHLGKVLVLATLTGPLWGQDLPDSITNARVGEWALYRETVQASVDGLPTEPPPERKVTRTTVTEVSDDQVEVEVRVEEGRRSGRTTRRRIDRSDPVQDRLFSEIYRDLSEAGGGNEAKIEILEQSSEPTLYHWNEQWLPARQIRIKSRISFVGPTGEFEMNSTLVATISTAVPVEGILELSETFRQTKGSPMPSTTTRTLKLLEFGAGE